MRTLTYSLAALLCVLGLTLAGCAKTEALSVQSGVTTSAGDTADAKTDCADCAGCADKAECDKAECDKADCDKTQCDKADGTTEVSDSVYPADSTPAKGVPAGSSSAPAPGAGST